MLTALAALGFLVTFVGFLGFAIGVAYLYAGFAALGHRSASFTELGVVYLVVGLVGLGAATGVAYAIGRSESIASGLMRFLRAAKHRVLATGETRQLRCHSCGTRYPSQYYFVDPSAERLACTRCAGPHSEDVSGGG